MKYFGKRLCISQILLNFAPCFHVLCHRFLANKACIAFVLIEATDVDAFASRIIRSSQIVGMMRG